MKICLFFPFSLKPQLMHLYNEKPRMYLGIPSSKVTRKYSFPIVLFIITLEYLSVRNSFYYEESAFTRIIFDSFFFSHFNLSLFSSEDYIAERINCTQTVYSTEVVSYDLT